MSIVEDVLKVLDRIPIWKRLQQIPAEVDEMKAAIVALKQKLGDTWPPDVCKFCGRRAARMVGSKGPDSKGNIHNNWSCSECNNLEIRAS